MWAAETTSYEHLTNAIKDNLIRKVRKYVDRSERERNSVVIFTNNVNVWKRKSPKGLDTSVRMDDPLPPIPPEYNRQLPYNIMYEMNWFIGEYTAMNEYHFDWTMYDTAEGAAKPQVHIFFANDDLEPPWCFLKWSSSTPLFQDPFRGGNSSRPTCVGRNLYRYLSSARFLTAFYTTIWEEFGEIEAHKLEFTSPGADEDNENHVHNE